MTVGFHRLLTHRAFQTYRPIRYALAIMGSLSLQGPVIDWVADHRKHHTFTDEEGDPHSPHAGAGAGLRGMMRGLWHAHVGWMFETQGQASSRRFARDLVEDPGMRRINRNFPWIALASLGVPFVLGFALSGGVAGRRPVGPAVGGPRADLPRPPHHVERSTRSATSSARGASTSTTSRRTCSGWRCPTLGEAWHHNHHAFPQSAFHGLRWYELDPSGWIILGMQQNRPGLGRHPRDTRTRAAQAGGRGAAADVSVRRHARRARCKPRLRGVSHQYAFFASLACGVALILGASGGRSTTAAAIYAGAVSALFGTSALYHRVTWRPGARRWMRRLDHSMIFVLIAGTYTPVALLALNGSLGRTVLIVVWAGAAAGVVFKLAWIDAPKWLFAAVYLALGWVAVVTVGQLPGADRLARPGRAGRRRPALHGRGDHLRAAGARTRSRGCSATTRCSTRSSSPPPRCTTR